MAEKYVYANSTCKVRFESSGVISAVDLKKGQTWHKSDPFVQARPDLFSDAPSVVHGTRGSEAVPASATPPPQKKAARALRDVEDGTAVPGAKRSGRSRE